MPKKIEPTSIKQLEDPAFLAWVRQQGQSPCKPDREDFDPDDVASTTPGDVVSTTEELAHLYRLAQARKLRRLWGKWKAQGN